MRSLTDLESALATYGGLSYLVSLPSWALWVVSNTTRFYLKGCTIYVHYYSLLFNGRIHSNIHLFIHVVQFLLFSLFFLCMLIRIILVARSISIWYLITPTWYQSTRLFKFNRVAELYVLSIIVHPLLYPSLKNSLFLILQYFFLVLFV